MVVFSFYLMILVGCNIILHPSERYRITLKGIKARTGCKITYMSISKFNRNDVSKGDIRPKEKNEIIRYSCWLNEGFKGVSSISFDKINNGYSWFPKKEGTAPFIVERGFVYQAFGLCDINGSYYFCIDSVTNKFVVQYQDAGPW